MRLTAAIQGDLVKFMREEKTAAEQAVTAGVGEISNQIKNELRAQVTGAGLGSRLAKSWQSKTYPGRGRASISAAGVVQCKATKIIRAFNGGALIKSSRGSFLAIPTEFAPKRGTGNKRISPATYPDKFGKLRFVRVNARLALLIADDTRKRKAGKVMFLLVPQVQLKKRLDYTSVVDRLVPQLPQRILEHWPERSE